LKNCVFIDVQFNLLAQKDVYIFSKKNQHIKYHVIFLPWHSVYQYSNYVKSTQINLSYMFIANLQF